MMGGGDLAVFTWFVVLFELNNLFKVLNLKIPDRQYPLWIIERNY